VNVKNASEEESQSKLFTEAKEVVRIYPEAFEVVRNNLAVMQFFSLRSFWMHLLLFKMVLYPIILFYLKKKMEICQTMNLEVLPRLC
jgi:hypothetical protein